MKKLLNVVAILACYIIVCAIGGAVMGMIMMPDRILQFSYAGGLVGIAYALIDRLLLRR